MSGSTELADWIHDERMKARTQALEEAARVAEETDWEALGPGWRTRDRIAAAIRALKDR